MSLNYYEFCCRVLTGVAGHIFYIDRKCFALNYQEFNNAVGAGLTLYVLYITLRGMVLDYVQYNSRIYSGLIVHILLADYITIYTTPSGICLLSNDPRTIFIFNHYKIGKHSKRTNFNRALKLYRRDIRVNYYVFRVINCRISS